LEKAIILLNLDRSQITTKPIDELRKDWVIIIILAKKNWAFR
jgi:hypothetical protein